MLVPPSLRGRGLHHLSFHCFNHVFSSQWSSEDHSLVLSPATQLESADEFGIRRIRQHVHGVGVGGVALGSAREHTPLSLSLSRVWDSTAILGVRDTVDLATP